MSDDTFPMADVKSSQIQSIGYDEPTGRLRVRFVDRHKADGTLIPGATYEYSGCAPEDHKALVNAESIGSHFGRHIRKNPERFPFRRIT